MAEWIASSASSAHNPPMPADVQQAKLKRKQNGVHYTPPQLGAFLAREMLQALPLSAGELRVLDPACGDGSLLEAFATILSPELRRRTTLVGYETDPAAIAVARCSLADCDVASILLQNGDFLADNDLEGSFDAVIANPPYVRTQVLGAARSQALAKRYGLSGRVDLAHAFICAITAALKPRGVMALLTANRFLSVRAGASTRSLLRSEFDLNAIFDLGDTRLFSAAVLPAITIATRRESETCKHRVVMPPTFDRVYASETNPAIFQQRFNLLDALADRYTEGEIRTPEGFYRIERGVLAPAQHSSEVWRMAQPASEKWLTRVRNAQAATFGDVATIRVGIKTTADSVFVRNDWDQLPEEIRPEPELLKPLITHREATRWSITMAEHQRQVLYPHVSRNGRRVPIELEDFPRAAAYLKTHAEQLRSRRYVTEAGRRWYEIWVAHDPLAWAQPKIVFPDIAETPRFSRDVSGAIVQGDCYWITLKPGVDPDWLPLMLAVANSSLATKFYDLAFHNKLYAGRRRYMTQYVEQFPLPDLSHAASQAIVRNVRSIERGRSDFLDVERELEVLVDRALGLVS